MNTKRIPKPIRPAAVAILCACANTTAIAGPVQARQADAFVASTAVVTQWSKPDASGSLNPCPGVYMNKFDELFDLLIDSGIRHIRDAGNSDDFIRKIQKLSDAGVKSVITLTPAAGLRPDDSCWAQAPAYNNTATAIYNIDDFIRKAGRDAIAYVEMNGSLDTQGSRDATRWHSGDTETLSADAASEFYYIDYIKAATASVKARLAADPALADIPLIGPAFARINNGGGDYLKTAGLDDFVDYRNIQRYYAGLEPETGESQGIDFAIKNAMKDQPDGQGRVVSEGGEAAANATLKTVWPAKVQGRYVPRYYLAYFINGFSLITAQELVDAGRTRDTGLPDTVRANNLGLIQNGFTLNPKPAYTALKNLLSVLKDPGPAFEAGSLDYVMTGDTGNVHTALFQKRNGDFYLCLWLGLPSYNPADGTLSDNPPQAVSLALPLSIQSARIFTLDDDGVMTAADASVASGAVGVSVTDRVTIVRLSAATSGGAASVPTGLRTVPASGRITLKWAPVFEAGSYIIKRAAAADGTFAIIATGVTATEYSDANVTDGDAVYYTVTASAPGGESAASAPVSAVPYKPIIDNMDAAAVTKVGAWSNSTAGPYGNSKIPADYYGTNTSNSNSATASSIKFTPAIAGTGAYDVYTRWVANSNRADNTPIDITHTGGVFSTTVNQKTNSGTWMLLGTFNFAAGTTGNLTILRPDGIATTIYTIADAVRFDIAPPRPPADLTATAGAPPVNLTWAAAANAGSYIVRRTASPDGPWDVLATGVTATSFADTTAAGGIYYYTVSSVNAGLESAPARFVAGTAGMKPVITSATALNATEGDWFEYQIVADYQPDSYGATDLPPGLSIDTASGLISGQLTESGDFTVALSATNATGTGTATLSLSILPLAEPPVITSPTSATGAVNSAFRYEIKADNMPLGYEAAGQPEGLVLDEETGVISGTPTRNGWYVVTISVRNRIGVTSIEIIFTIKDDLNASNFGDWNIVSPAEGTVVQKGEFLEVSYQSPQKAPLTLRPPSPVELPDGTSRIRLWFAGLEGDFDLTLLVVDAAGKEHEIKTETSRFFNDWTKPKSELLNHSRWYQADSNYLLPTAPLNERVQPEFLAKAQQMVWPGPHRLSGIKIKPSAEARNQLADPSLVEAGGGRLCLGTWDAISFDGLGAENNWLLEERGRWGWNTAPLIFPDDVCNAQGAIQYRLEMRRGFQGPVIWAKEGRWEIKPDDAPSLFTNAAELPVPPRGRYFLDCKAWNQDGTLVGSRWLQLYVMHSSAQATGTAQAAVEWKTGRDSSAFEPEEGPPKLALCFSKERLARLPADAKCEVVIRDWQEKTVFSGTVAANEVPQIEFKEAVPGRAYVIYGRILSGNKLLDTTQLMFGIKNLPEEPSSIVPESVPTLQDLMKNKVAAIAEHWGEYFQHYGPNTAPSGYGAPCTPERIAKFDAWIESIPQTGISVVAFYFTQNMIEPLPGVVFWDELERRIALAESLGLKVILTPTCPNSNPYRAPIWSGAMPMLDQYGYAVPETAAKLTWPSFWSFQSSYFPFLRNLAGHFAGNPTVIGYNLEKFASRDRESSETKSELRIADYSKEAQEQYRQWCAEQGRPVAPLARRFSIPGKDTPPAEIGPDLSAGWQATMEFRAVTGIEWVGRSIAAIRTVDPRRAIIIYQMGSLANTIPFLKDGATLLPEGGPNYNEQYMSSMFAQAGVPYPSEPGSFVPRSRSHIDSCYFYTSCFADEAFWKYRWHQDAFGTYSSLAPTLEFLKGSMPHFQAWYAARRMEPEVLVVGSQADNVLSGPRRLGLNNLAGFNEFVALYEFHQLPAHFANEYADWVDLAKFKAVFVAGEVFPRPMVEKLKAYLEGGGKIVMVGNAGFYDPRNPGDHNFLKNELGPNPNIRTIGEPANPVPAAFVSTHGHVKTMFGTDDLENVLGWAGVHRAITVAEPGFDALLRTGSNGEYHAAVLRRMLNGELPGSQPPDEITGTADCTISLLKLPPGKYRVGKYHRSQADIGTFETNNEVLSFTTSGIEQGELQLFKITLVSGFAPSLAPGGDLPPATTIYDDGSAVLSVNAGGKPPFLYQWQISTDGGAIWADVAGANASTLMLSGLTGADDGKLYHVIITNAFGHTVSAASVLVMPAFLSADKTMLTLRQPAGSNATFTVTANIAWTGTAGDTWMTLSPDTGTGGTTPVTVTAASANTTGAQRTASVTITGSGVTDQSVIVTQNAAGAASVPASLAEGAALQFDFGSGTTETYIVAAGNKLVPTGATGSTPVSYEYEAAGGTGTLVFDYGTWSLDFDTRTFTLRDSGAGGPSEHEGTFAYTVTVTFAAGAAGVPAPPAKTVSPGLAYGSLPSPSREGHTFDGWFTAATGGSQVTDATDVPVNAGNHTLYARWTGISAAGGKGGGGGGALSLFLLPALALLFVLRRGGGAEGAAGSDVTPSKGGCNPK
ncbi:MAG: putative Ig domain-containing protein [Opitutaceae bacterium]|jgi:uncharacterized repeat protein (TIGR02543 family)|nr:putative Ig domain-containing protein [Opitutaceae bacterium]